MATSACCLAYAAVIPDGEDVVLVSNAASTVPVGDTTVVWKATDPGGLLMWLLRP